MKFDTLAERVGWLAKVCPLVRRVPKPGASTSVVMLIPCGVAYTAA